jgi:hypothetical protein
MKRLLVSLVETKFETHLLNFLSLSQKKYISYYFSAF